MQPEVVEVGSSRFDAMNILASRIWEGQSVSAEEGWRVGRVLEGLKSHGYTDFSGLALPVENIGKYL